LNNQDYSSINQVLGDLEAIWTDAISTEMEIEKADFKVRLFFVLRLLLTL
jgi:actin-related protein 8